MTMIPSRLLFVLALAVFGASACHRAPSEQAPIGGGRDAHGCLPSAGYSWCDARQACLRPWESYCTTAKPNLVHFACDGGATIDATFFPDDDKFVDLVLPHDRRVSLPHAMSGSGARYAKADDSLIFWNKGNTAFVEEHGKTTIDGCVAK